MIRREGGRGEGRRIRRRRKRRKKEEEKVEELQVTLVDAQKAIEMTRKYVSI
jgi:hypothetical protein